MVFCSTETKVNDLTYRLHLQGYTLLTDFGAKAKALDSASGRDHDLTG